MRTAIAFLVGIACLGPHARGDLVTQDFRIDARPYFSSYVGSEGLLALPQFALFDPSLGHLDAVRLSILNLKDVGNSQLVVNSQRYGGYYPIDQTDRLRIESEVPGFDGLPTLEGYTSTIVGIAPDSETEVELPDIAFTDVTFEAPRDPGRLANFLAGPEHDPWLVLHIFQSSRVNSMQAPAAFLPRDGGRITGTVRLTYEYTPSLAVPEPSSLSLATAGAAGWALRCRRRRRDGTRVG